MSNLYEKIGAQRITSVITEFYRRAFEDPIIGHFFFEKDREKITSLQIQFATGMLGGPRGYQGKPLQEAHANLKIRRPHFGRRQVLMEEVLRQHIDDEQLISSWLALEDTMRGLIMPSHPN